MKHVSATFGLAVLFLATFFPVSATWGTELYTPPIKGEAGKSVKIPVVVDFVENLAGIKLVMTYDTQILAFEKAYKTRHTSSLMHIVNDKKPGTLVIVMAGARGIKGKDISILSLKFQIKKDVKNGGATPLKVTQIQMMSDQLKDIQCKVNISPLNISIGGMNPETVSEKMGSAEKTDKKTGSPETAGKKPEQSEKKAKNSVAIEQAEQTPEMAKTPVTKIKMPKAQKLEKDVRMSRPCPLAIPTGQPNDTKDCQQDDEKTATAPEKSNSN